jgi:hypothetical protein
MTQREYIIGNVLNELPRDESAAVVHLDDAWDRPGRADGGQTNQNAAGVQYQTHSFDGDGTSVTDVIEASWETLEDGGWLIMDVDDWLMPHAINFISDTYGNVNEPPAYEGGGYRKSGRVVYVTKSDPTRPNRQGTAKYLRQCGYPVVFAHKGETDRFGYASAVQFAHKQRERYGWFSTKPTSPYKVWIDELTEEGDTVVEPCAGTAPACIATQQLYGDEACYTAIDIEPKAKEAFYDRLNDECET